MRNVFVVRNAREVVMEVITITARRSAQGMYEMHAAGELILRLCIWDRASVRAIWDISRYCTLSRADLLVARGT